MESEDMFSVSYSFSGEETLESSKQNHVLDFIYQILRKRCEAGNYTKFLQDGSIIEELMVRACPTPLGKKMKNEYPKNPTPQQRVEKIINDMFEYGVSLENLFDPNDLIEAKDIPKVIPNITSSFRYPIFTIILLQLNPSRLLPNFI